MSPIQISNCFIGVLFILMIILFAMAFKDKKKVNEPEKEKVNPLLYYDSDFTIIAATIENSKNYWHLMTVLDDVNCFTLDYSKCQNENLLISDTNELLSRWRSKKIAYELEMFHLN